jgi:hemerythrin superfamily protein
MADQEFTDAIAMLKADHRKVEDLFAKFENASGDGRKQALAEQICTELQIHTLLEEEIFYPSLEGKIEEDTLSEAYVEHDGAKVLVNDIMAGGPDDEFYDSKVKVLQEEIEHHVQEEEKPSEGMFSQARDTDVDLVALRDQMMARKQELMAQAESGGLPPAQLTTMQEPAA